MKKEKISLIRNSQKSIQLSKIGWREWISLPDFNISHIKAKIDTGARTSAIHAINICSFKKNGTPMVAFVIRPIQKINHGEIECTAKVIDQRTISDSGGHRELRYIIETTVVLKNEIFKVELSLTNRATMNFRMILGRTALKKRFIVDPSTSYISGKFSPFKGKELK